MDFGELLSAVIDTYKKRKQTTNRLSLSRERKSYLLIEMRLKKQLL